MSIVPYIQLYQFRNKGRVIKSNLTAKILLVVRKLGEGRANTTGFFKNEPGRSERFASKAARESKSNS